MDNGQKDGDGHASIAMEQLAEVARKFAAFEQVKNSLGVAERIHLLDACIEYMLATHRRLGLYCGKDPIVENGEPSKSDQGAAVGKPG